MERRQEVVSLKTIPLGQGPGGPFPFKLKLVSLHIDSASAEPDTLSLQPETLLHGRIPPELDLAPRAQDALPRQIKSLP